MGVIKKMIVFSTGDSAQLSTWSNIPYLFTETLISNGVQVHRAQIPVVRPFLFFVLAAKRILSFLGFRTSYDYSRSFVHFWLSRIYMILVQRYVEHDAVLVLSASFAPMKTKKPLILFCDWPYQYYIQYFQNRAPDFLEKSSIRRENSLIESADFLFVLFPIAHAYMLKNYQNKNIFYLGNVINAIEKPSLDDVERKIQSRSLLFIGRPHYREGALSLISSFVELQKKYRDLELDIIGMDRSFFPNLPEGVRCHGFLDKGNSAERKKYYDLLRSAKVIVNPNPKWASFSATLEAMYFYIPVITSRYPEFEETFGCEIKFGFYADDVNKTLTQFIEDILNHQNYRQLCLNSHFAAQDFTWDKYVRLFLEKVNSQIEGKYGH